MDKKLPPVHMLPTSDPPYSLVGSEMCIRDRIRLATDFSMEMLQVRREWQKIFQVMRTTGVELRLLYPARLSIKIESQIRRFQDKRSLKEYTSTKPAIQEMLKGLL